MRFPHIFWFWFGLGRTSVPSIIQISSTHFHSIPPFYFAISYPSFFINIVSPTISNKRFFFFIINVFSNIDRNSIRSDYVVTVSFEFGHDTPFDLPNYFHKLIPLPYSLEQYGSRFLIVLNSPTFSFSIFIELAMIKPLSTFLRIDFHPFSLNMVHNSIETVLIQNIIERLDKRHTTICELGKTTCLHSIFVYFIHHFQYSILKKANCAILLQSVLVFMFALKILEAIG